MKILVVYETKHGNTERIARSIASGLGPGHQIAIEPVGPSQQIDPAIELLIVGGPTQAHGASPDDEDVPGRTSQAAGVRFAAFDTRFDKPRWMTGAASGVIDAGRRKHGSLRATPAQSFFVEHGEGPLVPGEEDRAAAWGATLVGRA